MTVTELLQQRVALGEKSKAILATAEAAKRDLNEAEQREFDALHGEIMGLKARADRQAVQEAEERETAERLEAEAKRERDLAQTRGRKTELAIVEPTKAQDRELALRSWALAGHGRGQITPEMRSAAQRLNFDLDSQEIEVRALNSVTNTQGQHSIPDEMMQSFYEVQKWFGSVRSVATVLNTSTGAPLPIPTVSDTANTGEIVADSGAVTTTVDPLFGQLVLDTFKYSSKAVLLSIELLQDSSIALPAYLGKALGVRIARIQNTHFTTGTGSGQPRGIVTASAVGKTAAATNAVTWDEIIDLRHSVDPAYRQNAAFMMHDGIAAAIRKLKDSQNQYLWEMSVQAGLPDRALGHPVLINNDMQATLATATKPIIFGAFDRYYVRDAGGPVFYRADELFLLNHQVAFLAFQRSDGDLIDTTAVKHLLMA